MAELQQQTGDPRVPDIQQAPEAEPAPAAPQASEPAPARGELSYEDRMLAEAEAELASEESGEPAAPQEQPGQVRAEEPAPAPAAPPPAPAQAEPQGGDEPRSVPYPRFAEVNQKLRTLEQQLAYERGAMEAYRNRPPVQPAPAAAPAPAEPPKPSWDDRIAAEETALYDLAQKVEAGTISMVDYEKGRRERDRAIRSIERERDAEAAKAAQPAPQPAARTEQPRPQIALSDQAILHHHVEQLQERHPYVAPGSPMTTQDAKTLEGYALAELNRAGVRLPTDLRGVILLREKVAELSDLYGPRWYPDYRPAPKAPSQPQPAPGTNGVDIAAQRMAKLDMAAAQPPDTTRSGRGGNETGLPTEAEIMAMTPDQLAALPDEVLNRLS